ncbi:uncharacterized protein LOC142462857 [Ascaphus truei]|uniref:uncharacterized protein LOC142462857 n=1 Tax=Ascaphus truei TaxID=8439 RepID=UPI003F59DA2C
MGTIDCIHVALIPPRLNEDVYHNQKHFHHQCAGGRTSSASRKEMWDTIVIGVNACGNHVRDKRNCHKRFDDIRSKLKKKIQHQRVHATGTGGGPTPQRLILSPLEELLRAKLLPVVVEGLPGDRDIGIYPSQFPPVAPEGHVSPETEQVSSPGSASSTHLEEHDEEDYDDDDDDDAAAAIDTQIQASDHEEVPIETVLPPNRPANTTYDAIVASEGKIVEAENRRHSDLMTVLERMIALQEETVSQLAHLHRVFIEVPKQLQKINTSFEALVVQQTQANYLRMTNVSQFNINTSQAGSVHAGQFSPHSSDLHSPGPNVTGQVADIAVQVPDDILPLPSVQIQQLTPTKEATKTKQDTHETDQPSLVQCLPTCSHVSVGTSPVREQSLPKSPVGESLPKSPVGESLPKSPVGESLPKSPVGESLPKSPVGESLATSPVGEQSLPKSPVGESLPKSPVGESLPKSPVGESLATSPAREVPEATQSGSVVAKRRDILKVEFLIEHMNSGADTISSLEDLKTRLEKFKRDLPHFKKQKFKKVVRDYKAEHSYLCRNKRVRRDRSLGNESNHLRGILLQVTLMVILWGNDRDSSPAPFLGQHPATGGPIGSGGGRSQTKVIQDYLVINLSHHELYDMEMLVLSKGPSYVPTVNQDNFNVEVDLFKFERNMNIKSFFSSRMAEVAQTTSTAHRPDTENTISECKLRSTFIAPIKIQSVSTYMLYICLIKENMTKYARCFTRGTYNMSLIEKVSLKALTENKNIIVQDYADYREEAIYQLPDTDSYILLTRDPIHEYAREIKLLIDMGFNKRWLLEKEVEFLFMEHPKCPVYYTLPKIHKRMIKPPGKPISAATYSLN